jgi:hypothetical protein
MVTLLCELGADKEAKNNVRLRCAPKCGERIAACVLVQKRTAAVAVAVAAGALPRVGFCTQRMWRCIRHGRAARRACMCCENAANAAARPWAARAAAWWRYPRNCQSLAVRGSAGGKGSWQHKSGADASVL